MKNKSKKKLIHRGGSGEEALTALNPESGETNESTPDPITKKKRFEANEEFTTVYKKLKDSLLFEKHTEEDKYTFAEKCFALIDEPCLRFGDLGSFNPIMGIWVTPPWVVQHNSGGEEPRSKYKEAIETAKKCGKDDSPEEGIIKYCVKNDLVGILGKPIETIKEIAVEAAETVSADATETLTNTDSDNNNEESLAGGGDDDSETCYPGYKSKKLLVGIRSKTIFCVFKVLLFPFLHIGLLLFPILLEFFRIIGKVLAKIFGGLWNSLPFAYLFTPYTVYNEMLTYKDKKGEEKKEPYIPSLLDLVPTYFSSIIPGFAYIIGINTEVGGNYLEARWGKGRLGKFIVGGAIISAVIIGISGISIVMVLIAFASYCAKVIGLLTSNVED